MNIPPDKFSQPETAFFDRCVAGDTGAFEKLVRLYQPYAYKLAFRIVWNEEDAKDIVQETFIRVWKNISKYDSRIRFTTWMYKIVTNLCLDKLKTEKRRRKHMTISTETSNAIVIPDVNNEDKKLADRDLVENVRILSKQLTAMQRLVFTLRDLQDLDIREIADILHMSPGAVKSNLYLARLAIRNKLEESDM